MSRRNAMIGLALIGAVALISTAWAGTGAHTAKKKSARGPIGRTGATGATGIQGPAGANGTARAFVHVTAADGTLPTIDAANSIPAGVTLCSNGPGDTVVIYSGASGVVPKNVIATPDTTGSTNPTSARTVRANLGGGGGCGGGPTTIRVITSLATTGADKATGFFLLIN